MESMQAYLTPTEFIDSDHPGVVEFAETSAAQATSATDKAIALYYAVRDRIRYDPYRFKFEPEPYRASQVLAEGAAYCIPKAILMCAGARALGIPAALGFADVKNHLNTKKLRRLMGTDTFLYHGYTALYLDERWIKVTPAFNIELCERFGVVPLDFDGHNDSLMHEFDSHNRRHMEYLNDHGMFADFPFERVIAAFREHYPQLEKFSRDPDALRFEDETPLLS
jgi:transglutaminase-like putative cysteine protease